VTAPLLLNKLPKGDRGPTLNKPCTATLVMLKKTCTRTAKTTPYFVHSGWYQDSTPRQLFCSSLRSLSNAY